MIYDKEQLKPLDNNRNGLNLGEGAGYVQLESAASIAKSGNKILAKLSGWCNANDSYHQTATSPDGDGPRMAIEGALRKAGLKAQEISYINAHGTSTIPGDIQEVTAIKKTFGDAAYKIPVSSTKSMTGHLLGAAGAVEAVASILAVVNDRVPPTINIDNQDPACDLNYTANTPQDREVNVALSNAFGFGGHNTCVVFRKMTD